MEQAVCLGQHRHQSQHLLGHGQVVEGMREEDADAQLAQPAYRDGVLKSII